MEKNQNQLAVIHLKFLGYPIINIRRCLTRLIGLDHKEIARIGGVSRPYITQNINGIRYTPKVMQKISEIYQVPLDDLFPDRPKPDHLKTACKALDGAVQHLQEKREKLHGSQKTHTD